MTSSVGHQNCNQIVDTQTSTRHLITKILLNFHCYTLQTKVVVPIHYYFKIHLTTMAVGINNLIDSLQIMCQFLFMMHQFGMDFRFHQD